MVTNQLGYVKYGEHLLFSDKVIEQEDKPRPTLILID